MAQEENIVSDKSGGQTRLKLSGLILVLLSSCFVLFTGLGQCPLFNPDEALYAEPAREMLVTGEYVTTLLNYVVRYTKPPLCIWAMALSYKVFGVNEYAARFFGVACALVLIAFTYLLIARYVSVRAAVVGALSLAVAPLFVLTAREAITDMPLALFMAGSQMAFFHAFKSRRFSFALAGYVLLGLAIMTKGPVGVVLPVAILFVYHFLRGELRAAWLFYRPLLGALIVALIAVPWFAVEITVTKGEYFQEFIVRENFQRFTAVVDNHKQPFWYHAAAMFGGYVPFALYLPQFFWLRRHFLSRLLRSEGGPMARLAALRQMLLGQSPAEDLYFYCFLWASAILVFFSMSVSKLLPYTLPAFPALAVTVAGELEAAFVSASFARVCYPILAMLFVYAGAGLVGNGSIAPALMNKVRTQMPGLPPLIASYAAMQGGVAFLAIVLGRLRKLVAAVTFFVVLSTAFFGVYLNLILPVVSERLEGQLPDFARFAGQSDLPIIIFDMRKPGVPFYALRKVENINGGDELKQRLSQLPSAYILTRVNKLDFLSAIQKTRIVSRKGDYALLQYSK
ncbi:MAG: glycosyltransferase family 39 protein [Cyanobacteria bacterium SZAS LIN-3]|nr:glycosyltransferase family 39 protein [Cyanobacteria bacterium SZAS LIN-3]